jgi:glycine hydroxymethyltransferase
MIAAASTAHPSVLACHGAAIGNVTTEGYPGARYHGGCEIVDEVERLAVERARTLFRAQYANVQPHSATTANEAVLFSLLRPGAVLLGLDLDAGGHLTHGAKASVTGRVFQAAGYGVDESGLLSYDRIQAQARQVRPEVIICGASAYPRLIDFRRFRQIADEVGAYLIADISHVAGLVAAGLHPNPVDHAHITTTSTYKQLCGPRGGLILMGRDASTPVAGTGRTLAETIDRAVFPFFQGTPDLAGIAAKAAALARAATPAFARMAERIVADAAALVRHLSAAGYQVVTGGTDNHMVVLNLVDTGLTGLIAQRALEECDIVVNKNRIPGDRKGAHVTSGLRLGTNSLALRGLDAPDMKLCAELVHYVLTAVRATSDRDYVLDDVVRQPVRDEVHRLCGKFPFPGPSEL